ncbi:MAG: energy-coupled thiamine transporter ThiT [Oscillospiraceae bacterium]|nr:energy-coupled thiamine transporter ThiT [Oscillospiraceae bacterium]
MSTTSQPNVRPSTALRLTESAILLALGLVLTFFPLVRLPYGGSVTACCMLPAMIIAYRYRPAWGLLPALIFSVIQLFDGGFATLAAYGKTVPFFLLILFFDYVFAFASVSLAGVFRGRLGNQRTELLCGILLACGCRYVCHVISGITVWAGTSIPQVGALSFSMIYNATYMVPETIVTLIGGAFLAGVFDFTAPNVRHMVRTATDSKGGVVCSIVAVLSAIAGLVFTVAQVFGSLQSPDSGTFDITGIATCDWGLIGIVCGVAAAVALAALLLRKFVFAPKQ